VVITNRAVTDSSPGEIIDSTSLRGLTQLLNKQRRATRRPLHASTAGRNLGSLSHDEGACHNSTHLFAASLSCCFCRSTQVVLERHAGHRSMVIVKSPAAGYVVQPYTITVSLFSPFASCSDRVTDNP
jgi:hypothetical protein